MDWLRSILGKSEPASAAARERGARNELLDAFLRASHGRLGTLHDVHRDALEKDAIFYGHLSRWYMDRGCIRDHQEMFVSHLLASPWPFHRIHARVLMQRLRTYQVARVIKYSKETLHAPGRPLRRAVEAWLRRREAIPDWFDECAIRDRRSLKGLYGSLHIRPCPRAEQILFADNPPPESRVHAARQLGKLRADPAAQARLIVERHIHYTTALGAIEHFTPAVLYALISVMTPPQVITNLAFLHKRGGFNHAETRRLLDQRIRDAATCARLSDFKIVTALRQVGCDPDLTAALLRATEERLRGRGAIDRPTALLVDKSGSMEEAIEIGKLLAIMCSTIATDALHVFAFDSVAIPIRPPSPDMAGWQAAFAPVRADGGTSIGAPLARLAQRVEQIVLISDGEENVAPTFRAALEEYEARQGAQCRVVFVKVRSRDRTPIETSMENREMTVIPFQGDYYNLPNVIPMLCSTPRHLLAEVLETPLYTLDDLDRLPPGYDEERHEIL
jgi:hypothetical protein